MILVTRPNHDHGTNYLYYWTKLIVDKAFKMGFSVTDLLSQKATKKNFVSYYVKHKHKLVFLNGHGDDDLITGYNDEVLVDTLKNKLNMVGSIVVARSCMCAKVLGNFLVANGSLAFIGYKDDYVIKTSRKYTTKPLLDPMASLYLEPSNMIVESLLKGKNVSDADVKSRRMLLRNISKVLSGGSKDKDDTVRYLYHDFKNQVVIGNLNARL